MRATMLPLLALLALPMDGGCAAASAPLTMAAIAPPAVPTPGPAPPGATPVPRVLLGDYSPAAWSGWDNVTYWPWSPKNDYQRVAAPGGEWQLRATSRDAGSMWLRKVAFDPRTMPIVTWRWKVAGPLPRANELANGTDDAPARVYFVWGLRDRGDLFKSEALGYIWGQARKAGEIGASPFSPRIGIVCLRSGKVGAGQWQTERRDLAADYRAYFHRDPGPVSAIAILTDTDQTDGQTTSLYGPVHAEARPLN